MIFIDTSAIYALADRADPWHQAAKERFEGLLRGGERPLTHNYVLIESMALLQHRLGLDAAIQFGRDARAFVIEWIGEKTHEKVLNSLRVVSRREVSFVDHVSFFVMRSRGVRVALAFDRHFEAEGFGIFGS